MDKATLIRFGSVLKGYGVESSDDDLIYFEKLSPIEYRKEFVLGQKRMNEHSKDADVIHSTELIGLRGIVTGLYLKLFSMKGNRFILIRATLSGKYYYLALFQWQIPDESRRLKDLVSELGIEYYDRIYNVLRRLTMDVKRDLTGKNGLQQLYAWQAACYVKKHKRCPDFQQKFPECLTVPEYKELYEIFLDKRDEILPKSLVNRLLESQPHAMEPIPHDDDVFYKKILDYVLHDD